MRVRLDHVGIAVEDLERSLAFFRDAFDLHVEESEDVASQRVRAHFLAAGDPKLELLEATAADSAIAKYIDKRGPGLHHIAFRVDDIHAALAMLKGRGVRLIDEAPRPGAEGALVAFIHPSAAHGVLVELKQARRGPVAAAGSVSTGGPAEAAPGNGRRFTTAPAYRLGALELISLSDGFFHLDGGAMFGVVPRTLWEKRMPPDGRNRITLGMRPLLVRGERTLLIDAGCGDKMDGKSAEIYRLERAYHLDHALAEAGLAASDIDIVLASHLHFDHVGGFTALADDGRVVPRFPRASYVAHRGEWQDATHPHERNRASYRADDFVPLEQAGVLELVDDDAEVMPGVRLRRSGGHTQHHQVVMIESRGEIAVFTADMFPTAVHAPDAWLMGYDLYPMDTLAFKRAFAREAIEREYLIFFEHDPSLAAGRIREAAGKRSVERVL
ncbi:MAG TPA: methylmalonyl-CoA epimerase [Vicinamibacterales bacterium]|nr:methylmalonyl-CoA epimerase [Vicinamibacterales bacterium]